METPWIMPVVAYNLENTKNFGVFLFSLWTSSHRVLSELQRIKGTMDKLMRSGES